jgi:hypothetical protein
MCINNDQLSWFAEKYREPWSALAAALEIHAQQDCFGD